MNPLNKAWLVLKAAGREAPVGGSKTHPTWSNRPGPLGDDVGDRDSEAYTQDYPRHPIPMVGVGSEQDSPVMPPHSQGRGAEEEAMWRDRLKEIPLRQEHLPEGEQDSPEFDIRELLESRERPSFEDKLHYPTH